MKMEQSNAAATAELARMCCTISEKSKADCFFEFQPHVMWSTISVYMDGWKRETNMNIQMIVRYDSPDSYKKAAKLLRDIANDLGVRL